MVSVRGPLLQYLMKTGPILLNDLATRVPDALTGLVDLVQSGDVEIKATPDVQTTILKLLGEAFGPSQSRHEARDRVYRFLDSTPEARSAEVALSERAFRRST